VRASGAPAGVHGGGGLSPWALGVGLNTTLFSVVNAVLLRNTPVPAPDRLVEIYSSLSDEFPYLTTSYADYLSIRDGPTR
jgi:hypothetical protein